MATRARSGAPEEDVMTGRTAVVTGGSTGIGLATARAIARAGGSVILAGRDEERGRHAAEQIEADDGAARFVRTDVRDDAEVAALAARAAEEFGSLDIWFNNAAVEEPPASPLALDDDVVRTMLETNLKGVYSGIRHAAASMAAGGVVINMGAFVGNRIFPPPAIVYGPTKAGVVAMTAAAAPLLAESNIEIFALCPCIVDTPMTDRVTGGAGEEARRQLAAQVAPSGSLTPPEDIARFVLELCAGATEFKSGDAIVVDAGPTAERL